MTRICRGLRPLSKTLQFTKFSILKSVWPTIFNTKENVCPKKKLTCVFGEAHVNCSREVIIIIRYLLSYSWSLIFLSAQNSEYFISTKNLDKNYDFLYPINIFSISIWLTMGYYIWNMLNISMLNDNYVWVHGYICVVWNFLQVK